MAKIVIHDAAARRCLARGVQQITRMVEGTLGPKGMNAHPRLDEPKLRAMVAELCDG